MTPSPRPSHAGHGLTIGLDRQFGDDDRDDPEEDKDNRWFVGLNVAAEDSRLVARERRNSRMEMEARSVGGYLATRFDHQIQLRAGVVYSRLHLESRREIMVPGLESTAQAKFNGHKRQIFLELSKDIELGERTMMSPYLNLTDIRLHTERALETGSPAALEIPAQSNQRREGTFGIRSQWRLDTEKPTWIATNAALVRAWGIHIQGRVHPRLADGTGDALDVMGVSAGRTVQLMSLNWQRQLINPKASIRLGYHRQWWHQREFGCNYDSANLQFKWLF